MSVECCVHSGRGVQHVASRCFPLASHGQTDNAKCTHKLTTSIPPALAYSLRILKYAAKACECVSAPSKLHLCSEHVNTTRNYSNPLAKIRTNHLRIFRSQIEYLK